MNDEFKWKIDELDLNFTTEESEKLINPDNFNNLYISLPEKLNKTMLHYDDEDLFCFKFGECEKPFINALAALPELDKIDFSNAVITDACETSAAIGVRLKADPTVEGYLIIFTPEKV